jgi:hypothetical protein
MVPATVPIGSTFGASGDAEGIPDYPSTVAEWNAADKTVDAVGNSNDGRQWDGGVGGGAAGAGRAWKLLLPTSSTARHEQCKPSFLELSVIQ